MWGQVISSASFAYVGLFIAISEIYGLTVGQLQMLNNLRCISGGALEQGWNFVAAMYYFGQEAWIQENYKYVCSCYEYQNSFFNDFGGTANAYGIFNSCNEAAQVLAITL